MPIVTVITTTDKDVLVSVQAYYMSTNAGAEALKNALQESVNSPEGHLVYIDVTESGTSVIHQYLNGDKVEGV